MEKYQVAHFNLALARAPYESPIMHDFVANLDRIYELAERSPGFVWRLMAYEDPAVFGERYIVNISVWEDVKSLQNFVFKSAHIEIMRRRKEWFQTIKEAYTVLWWVPAGHHPDFAESKSKLELLRADGPSQDAFTFNTPFPNPLA